MAAATANSTGDGKLWAAALYRAREASSAHLDAVLALRDAKSIRLQLLKDDLDAILATSPEAREACEPTLFAGEPPRLWIDLVTYVVMEPDPRTYRLIQDREGAREILSETEDRATVLGAIREHVAHRVIARLHGLAAPAASGLTKGPDGIRPWIIAAISFMAGAAALLITLIILKSLKF